MKKKVSYFKYYIISDPAGEYLPEQYGYRGNAEAIVSKLNAILDRQGDEGCRYAVGAVDHDDNVSFDI